MYNELLKYHLRTGRFPRPGDASDFADFIWVVNKVHARNGMLPASIQATYETALERILEALARREALGLDITSAAISTLINTGYDPVTRVQMEGGTYKQP